MSYTTVSCYHGGMGMVVKWALSAIAIGIAAYLLPGVTVTPLAAVVLAVILGVINVFVKPVVHLLALPLTIVTLGLFALVINACFILLAAWLVPDFVVAGFWAALLFSIVLALLNAFFALWEK